MASIDIQPFKIAIAPSALRDLAKRLKETRWPDEASQVGWQQGAPLAYMKELVDYWLTAYDWRQAESELNQFDQFRATIDGHSLHFIHQKAARADALPLLLLHGWPGSIVEFLPLIEPLSQPTDAREAFHVIIPTLPGFGFSGPADHWHASRAAKAFAQLMTALNYPRYVVHGEDVGAIIAREMGLFVGDSLGALHLTQLFHGQEAYEQIDEADPGEVKARELNRYYQWELGAYGLLQGTRPQSLAYGLTDSPVGQLAWIIERFLEWTSAKERPEEVISRDQLLTNVMVYWLNKTAGSAARYYAEGRNSWQGAVPISTKPTAFLQMPDDISRPIKRLALEENRIFRWTESPRGGHFAAFEQPALIVEDLRRSFFHSDDQAFLAR